MDLNRGGSKITLVFVPYAAMLVDGGGDHCFLKVFFTVAAGSSAISSEDVSSVRGWWSFLVSSTLRQILQTFHRRSSLGMLCSSKE